MVSLALDRIEAENPDGVCRFFAVFMRHGEELKIPTPVEALTSYSAFQRLVLMTLGLMFTASDCEGRPTDAADENWRQAVAYRLELGRQAQLAQQG